MEDLQGVGIFEKDVNGDVFPWIFPSIEDDNAAVIKARSGLAEDKDRAPFSFLFTRYKHQWQYIVTSSTESATHPNVRRVSIYLLARSFDPTKFEALLRLLLACYLQSGSVAVLECYLSVFTTGKVSTKLGSFDATAFDGRRALISPVQNLFKTFGVEAILIWVAVLCKKRILVVGDGERMDELLSTVRSIPACGGWHRQNWDLLRPYTRFSDAELKDLESCGVYVAGTCDSDAANRSSLYDLLVDLSARTIMVAEHAKESFIMTKFHKQTAESLVSSAETLTDQMFIKAVAQKTNELRESLNTLRVEHPDGSFISFEDLQARKLPRNMDQFLFNVALAEGLTRKG